MGQEPSRNLSTFGHYPKIWYIHLHNQIRQTSVIRYLKQYLKNSYHHVCVSDSFHFVHVVTFNYGIEARVQIVEEVHYLKI